jgi:hypothetical protein
VEHGEPHVFDVSGEGCVGDDVVMELEDDGKGVVGKVLNNPFLPLVASGCWSGCTFAQKRVEIGECCRAGPEEGVVSDASFNIENRGRGEPRFGDIGGFVMLIEVGPVLARDCLYLGGVADQTIRVRVFYGDREFDVLARVDEAFG